MQKEQVVKFNTYFSEIEKRRKELSKKVSELDLKEQDILHFLETESYNAVVMVKATKKIKLLRQERRVFKQELSVVDTIYNRMKKPIQEQKFVGGIYKTNVIKELLD